MEAKIRRQINHRIWRLGFDMRKRKNIDPLISRIELVLDLGQFISYNQSWDFVHDLEDIKDKIDDLMESGEADRTVRLYELFLSGCYEKAEEIDDSGGNLGMFFQDLFLSWITARQKAGCDQMWLSLVNHVRKDHSRKYSFIGDFEEIAAGNRPEPPESFEKRARKTWKKQTSK